MQVFDAPELGAWTQRVRRAYKSGKLPQHRQEKLEATKFMWKVDTVTAKWHHNFHETRRYMVSQ